MEIVLIANEKGGTAKTATCLSLANCLTALGYRVLAVDFDPSGNLSAAALPDFPKHVLYDVLTRKCSIHDAIVHTDICDILPTVKDIDSELNLDPTDFGNIAEERKSLNELAVSWTGRKGAEYILKSLLWSQKFALYDLYDFVLIDSAPSDNILLTNAIVAAKSVIVPCEPTNSSADGLHMFVASVHAARRCYDTEVTFDGLLFTKYDEKWETRRKRITEILEKAKWLDLRVYKTRFRNAANVEDSMNECRPILSYMYYGTGAADAMNITLEFLQARDLAPKTDFSGVFKDESGAYVFRKNGDPYFVVVEKDSGPVAHRKFFHQKFLSDPAWTEELGKTNFIFEEFMRKVYPNIIILP